MKYLTVILILIILPSCVDPFGATTRQNIYSNSQVDQARVMADAQKEVARLQSEAVETTAVQTTVRTGIIVAVLPWLVLIVCITVIVGIVVNWQGRIWYSRTTGPSIEEIERRAAQKGYRLKEENGYHLLVNQDNQVIGKRLINAK